MTRSRIGALLRPYIRPVSWLTAWFINVLAVPNEDTGCIMLPEERFELFMFESFLADRFCVK